LPRCILCGSSSKIISSILGVCVDCIRGRFDEALEYIVEAHRSTRIRYKLPGSPPRSKGGVECNICSNKCSIGEGEYGFCGLRYCKYGRLQSIVSASKALLYGYLDPHVTNCCASWFCPGGTGMGYPKYAYKPTAEYGYYNYALFFYGCNFDCLFCQNYSHRILEDAPLMTIDELVEVTLSNPRISCWCFFGGSPEPQLPFAIRASSRVLEEKPRDRVIRICFEWNGCGNPKLVEEACRLSLVSGGIVKFDLKAFSRELSYALSGVDNREAYRNFEHLYYKFYSDRVEVPLLMATTLLVPGYVDEYEVESIARFLADLNPDIPYSLLVFHPDYAMRDLPVTPPKHVRRCYEVASKHLRRVHIGNLTLLHMVYGVEA